MFSASFQTGTTRESSGVQTPSSSLPSTGGRLVSGAWSFRSVRFIGGPPASSYRAPSLAPPPPGACPVLRRPGRLASLHPGRPGGTGDALFAHHRRPPPGRTRTARAGPALLLLPSRSQSAKALERWREEGGPRHGPAELHEPIVETVAAHAQHPAQHPLGHVEASGIGDEEQPVLRERAIREAVVDDLELPSVLLDDRSCNVGRRGLEPRGQFPAIGLSASDGALLVPGAELGPSCEVMNVTLCKDVTSA